MPDKQPSPLLNPVLRLLTPNRPTPPGGGGKSSKNINQDRLRKNRKRLPKQIDRLKKTFVPETTHAGMMIVHTKMYEDRLRPTLTPDDFFDFNATQTQLVTSTPDGYLVEASIDSLDLLKNRISSPTNINTKVDISSVKSIKGFLPDNIFPEGCAERLWATASTASAGDKEFKTFSIWLLPFVSREPKKSVAKSFLQIAKEVIDDSISPTERGDKRWISSAHGESQLGTIQLKLQRYLAGDSPRIPLKLTQKKQLDAIIASGTACRIDPVTPPQSSIRPGIGKEPTPPTPNIANSPVVAIVDGGLTAKTYNVAVAWKPEDSFVPAYQANRKHGNQVASLVVDASGWNNQLDIPNTPCRIAPVPVVPKDDVTDFAFDEDELLDYLDQLMAEHPETKVWNFSFNQPIECEENAVSTLGHGLHKLARKHKVLPIISAGNKMLTQTTISPPADCESAIVVSGRKHTPDGIVDVTACDMSRYGLGPHNTLRPDVSWFSTLRVIGGEAVTGTSYAAPLVSRVAAHTYANLKHPSPDIVKAIILNNTDLDCHNYQLGWGSPVRTDMPWACPEGVVTLAWESRLESGQEYHWHDIMIPPTMLENGKIKGEIRLTAILNPRINNTGIGQYFLSRLETNIQCKTNGKYQGIMDACKTNVEIGNDGAKWNPSRVHIAKIPQGRACPEGKVRLRARVFLRDKFSLDTTLGNDRPGIVSDVAFALTFICTDHESAPETYNTFMQVMQNSVESAVIEQDIQVST